MAFTLTARMICSPVGISRYGVYRAGSIASGRPALLSWMVLIIMYCSYEFFGDTPDQGGHREALFVSQADNPLGPFGQEKQILHPFSIDSQIVQNESGLYLFYSTNTFEGDRIGTYIVVDKMLDPYTPAGHPVPVVVPTLDEEIFRRDRYKKRPALAHH